MTPNPEVYVYVGLNRKGNVVEFVTVRNKQEVRKAAGDCRREKETETEPVASGDFQFMRARQQAPTQAAAAATVGTGAPVGAGTAPVAAGALVNPPDVGGAPGPDGGTTEETQGELPATENTGGTDPCCIKLPSGQIICFC